MTEKWRHSGPPLNLRGSFAVSLYRATVLCAAWVSGCSAGVVPAVAGGETDDSVVALVDQIAEAGPQLTTLWPGFWQPDEAFGLYTDSILVVYHDGPVGGEFAPTEAANVWTADARSFELPVAYSRDFVLGQDTTTVAAYGDGPASAVETLVHEHFHSYQGSAFRDNGASQFIPTQAINESFIAAVQRERELLAKALESAEPRDLIRRYLVVRDQRLHAVSAAIEAAEIQLERIEGTAYLIGLRAAQLVLDTSPDSVARRVVWSLRVPLDSLPGGPVEQAVRFRVYGTGAASALLLERMNVDWRDDVAAGEGFGALLAEAVAFTPREGARVAREPAPSEAQATADSTLLLVASWAGPKIELSYVMDPATGLSMDVSGEVRQPQPKVFVFPDPAELRLALPGGSIVVRHAPTVLDVSNGLQVRLTIVLEDAVSLDHRSTADGIRDLRIDSRSVSLRLDQASSISEADPTVEIQVDGTSRPPSCLPLNENVLAYAVDLATASDTSTATDRAIFRIPAVAASEVEYVSDDSTCRSAGQAYKTAAGLKGKAPAVLVIRIGSRYLVSSPASQTDESEFVLYVVMDDQFNRLAAFAS